jgi:hypothetical protein
MTKYTVRNEKFIAILCELGFKENEHLTQFKLNINCFKRPEHTKLFKEFLGHKVHVIYVSDELCLYIDHEDVNVRQSPNWEPECYYLGSRCDKGNENKFEVSKHIIAACEAFEKRIIEHKIKTSAERQKLIRETKVQLDHHKVEMERLTSLLHYYENN